MDLQDYRAGLPPTIAIAMFESKEVSDHYTTLGYMIAIVSILGFCIMPRAKFIQTMSMNVLAICVGAAVGTYFSGFERCSRDYLT